MYIYIYMVSGTLNNSNFCNFKSYRIFEILVIFSTFILPKRIRNVYIYYMCGCSHLR